MELVNLARVIVTGRLMHHAGETRSFTGRAQARLARMMGVEHALLVNSGTSALIVALKAAGVGPGDEVLVPAYTWVSTASAPLALGAVPILVEVDESLTMDPEDLERKITRFSKAVIPVHMLNLVCDMDRIMTVADRHGLTVIEDACQAVGVSYKGRRVGSIGHLGAFSFNHYKNVTSGEGGAVITGNQM
jgi:dTDP-4-amino-4,6-dideoxygalactose transaminase